MRVDVNNGQKPVTKHPLEGELRAIRERVGEERYLKMVEEIEHRVHGSDVATASFMPSNGEWQGTCFAPLLEIAGDDRSHLGRLLGCIVWQHFMDRPESWGFRRNMSHDHSMGGIFYFRMYSEA